MGQTYTELLRSPEWAKRREQIIAREQCQECGRYVLGCKCSLPEDAEFTDRLEVHHRYYLRGRRPWEYPDEALSCLCRQCHEQLTLATDVLKIAAGLLPLHRLELLVSQAKSLLLKEAKGDLRIAVEDLPEEIRTLLGR